MESVTHQARHGEIVVHAHAVPQGVVGLGVNHQALFTVEFLEGLHAIVRDSGRGRREGQGPAIRADEEQPFRSLTLYTKSSFVDRPVM